MINIENLIEAKDQEIAHQNSPESQIPGINDQYAQFL